MKAIELVKTYQIILILKKIITEEIKTQLKLRKFNSFFMTLTAKLRSFHLLLLYGLHTEWNHTQKNLYNKPKKLIVWLLLLSVRRRCMYSFHLNIKKKLSEKMMMIGIIHEQSKIEINWSSKNKLKDNYIRWKVIF